MVLIKYLINNNNDNKNNTHRIGNFFMSFLKFHTTMLTLTIKFKWIVN